MRWTAELVTMFVEEIHEEVVVKGTATENGMKKETWNAIQKEVNRKSSLKLEKDQLQSKYSELKSKYGVANQYSFMNIFVFRRFSREQVHRLSQPASAMVCR